MNVHVPTHSSLNLFYLSLSSHSELQPEPWGVPRLPEWEGVGRGGVSPGVSAGGGGDRYRSGPLPLLHHHHRRQPAQRQPTPKPSPQSELRSVWTSDFLTKRSWSSEASKVVGVAAIIEPQIEVIRSHQNIKSFVSCNTLLSKDFAGPFIQDLSYVGTSHNWWNTPTYFSCSCWSEIHTPTHLHAQNLLPKSSVGFTRESEYFNALTRY